MTRAAPERNREHTAQRIVAAVGEVLARDGFGGIGINAIARQAGVDKVLIYRYYGGLPQLLQAFGASGSFWPGVDEMLGPDPAAMRALPEGERWGVFIGRFIDGLRARPLTLEILASEVNDRNELAAILETERERWGEQVGQLLGGPQFARRAELLHLTLLVIAGVQYLLVRARRIQVFGGIDIRSDDGWATLKASLSMLARQLMDSPAAGR
ncbi:MAG: TetR/AcrR family transcriptional regulator [Aquabacterium sp.]